jgi:hypothetical protein
MLFRSLKSLMHSTHETQRANRNEPGAYLRACAEKAYTYLNKHYKNKNKSRAYLEKYLETPNGPGVLIHIHGMAQDEIAGINGKPGLSFKEKFDLQERPRRIQELVKEAFLLKQQAEIEAAAMRPAQKSN